MDDGIGGAAGLACRCDWRQLQLGFTWKRAFVGAIIKAEDCAEHAHEKREDFFAARELFFALDITVAEPHSCYDG